MILTSAIGEVGFRAEGSAAGVARAEVGEAVVAANGLDVGHPTLASEVAGGSEIDLEWLGSLGRAVEVRYGRAGHFNIVTAEEKQETVAGQAYYVRYEDELNGPLRPQLESLQ